MVTAGCWINYTGNRPTKQHKSDAGFDLCISEGYKIPKNGSRLVSLGTAVKIPSSHYGMLTHRSSLATKRGCTFSLGIIDSGYTGDLKALVINHTSKDVWLEAGERIGQLLIIPCRDAIFQEGLLPTTDRGDGGFGSTGDA